MKAVVQPYWLPKVGNERDEYEDACWPSKSLDHEGELLRLAVADGATESSFSGLWARQLARTYCRQGGRGLQEKLPRLEQVWKRHVGAKALSWYAQQKLESGAFSAIVGVELLAKDRCWTGFAVGDCCAFQTRGMEIIASFPLDKPELFDSRPWLLSSLVRNNDCVTEHIQTRHGTWVPHDTFYLMSDAIAVCFLRLASVSESDAVSHFKAITDQNSFDRFVETKRKEEFKDGSPMMKNDDVTLLICTVT